jgi:type VI secretion system secreted protein VgrG
MSIGFLDGDPDRPIVLQKLYNRETMPPYAMPDNKTQGALQSATSPGGGATNEIRLQDGSGGMEFFVHSSKDLAVLVGNNAIEEIKVDVHEEIGLTLDTRVGVNETVKVGAAQSVSVTGAYSEDTVANKTVNVGALDDWGVTSKLGIKTNGNRTESIGGMMNVLANQVIETYNSNYKRTVGAVLSMNTASALVEAVGGSKTETVGGAKMELVAKAKAEDVKGSKTLTSGLVSEKTGTDLAVSAMSALTLNVGGPIVEKIAGDFQMDGAGVIVTSAGGAEIKVGGTTVSAKSGKISIKASSVGGAGGPQLKLVGHVDYKE